MVFIVQALKVYTAPVPVMVIGNITVGEVENAIINRARQLSKAA
ncbi:hypothetical protein AB3538_16295 [Acinetobacter baumannii]